MNWYKQAIKNKNIIDYSEEEQWDDYDEDEQEVEWADEEEKEKWEEQQFQSEFGSLTEEEILVLSETKVVDELGEPLTVYHGTDENFDQFQYTDSYRYVLFSRFPVKTKGFFFSPSFKDAKEYGKNVIPAKLNMKNPLLDGSAGVDRISPELEKELAYILEPMIEVDDQGRENIDIGIQKYYIDRNDPMWVYNAIEYGKLAWDAADNDGVVERMRERGYDGTLVQESNDYSGTSYFVLNPEQVVSLNKSAKVKMNWFKKAELNNLRKAIRYTHADGTGLLNNQGLDYTKLNDDEYFELEEERLGLQQPMNVPNTGIFYFTEEGEQKHSHLIELFTKASIKGVVRAEVYFYGEPIWESDDGQIALNKSQMKAIE